MKIKTAIISTSRLKGKSMRNIIKTVVLTEEVKGVLIEFFSMKGTYQMNESSQSNFYDVLLSLKGNSVIQIRGRNHTIYSGFIARIPYNEKYDIRIGEGEEFHFLRIRKSLDDKNIQVINQNKKRHEKVYLKAISECPEYSEGIKSDKTVNRMILPEGMVPRFCMGSVETTGPDEVGEHDHPMLDQLFFGLAGCRCTCYAENEKAVLTENMMLHIPLGSKHAVSVAEGDRLAYIWLDFFLTLEGQKYMNEQHQMDE
jgi:mannose-6-phosphate isomerase-like protein (cupin superfamily)